ncbi:hypothetical protein Peur_019694 [Populus x canadensis]
MKVPSFPEAVAMALIDEELGQPWQNIYSELSPSPGRVKENGDLVAVKTWRPFALETVTVDLSIIRNLGCWPKTHQKSTSRKVLTTEWIEGEKLSQSTESDVGSLVNGGSCHMLPEAGTPPMHSYHASAPSP